MYVKTSVEEDDCELWSSFAPSEERASIEHDVDRASRTDEVLCFLRERRTG